MRLPSSTSALLMIDVLNDFQFPGAESLLTWARRLTPRLLDLRQRARKSGVPVIYTNDNYGLWHSDQRGIYQHCTQAGLPGRSLVRRLKPGSKDYFLIKPRHSAFFATSLKPLLEDLGTRTLVLTGMATNLCVLMSAHDGHMHGYKLVVASDCCAAESDFDHDVALRQLETFCHARIRRGDEVAFAKPAARRRRSA
jgi:nicotinamidase-related amidase